MDITSPALIGSEDRYGVHNRISDYFARQELLSAQHLRFRSGDKLHKGKFTIRGRRTMENYLYWKQLRLICLRQQIELSQYDLIKYYH